MHGRRVFNVGRSMFDVQSVRPARNVLKPVWGQFNHLIYISMSTPTHRAMHGRRVFFFLVPPGQNNYRLWGVVPL
jgi:hypothetical protein